MNKKNIVLFALACGVVCQDAGAYGTYGKAMAKKVQGVKKVKGVQKVKGGKNAKAAMNGTDGVSLSAVQTTEDALLNAAKKSDTLSDTQVKDIEDFLSPFQGVVPNKKAKLDWAKVETRAGKRKPGLSNDAVEGVDDMFNPKGGLTNDAAFTKAAKEAEKQVPAKIEKTFAEQLQEAQKKLVPEGTLKVKTIEPAKIEKTFAEQLKEAGDNLKKEGTLKVKTLPPAKTEMSLAEQLQEAQKKLVPAGTLNVKTIEPPKIEMSLAEPSGFFKKAGDTLADGKEWVKNNPGKSIAIATTAGVGVGTGVGMGISADKKNNSTEEAPQGPQPPVEQPQVEQPQVEAPQVEQPQVEQPQVEQPQRSYWDQYTD